MKRLLYGSLLVVTFFACKHKESDKENLDSLGVNIETVIVDTQKGADLLQYDGSIIPTVNVLLSFLVPGTVVEMYGEIGDHVKTGQVLAKLDETTYLSAYNGALAMQKQAEDAYNRLKIVYDKGSLPEIKWEEIKSQFSQANSSLALAKKNLDNCTIKASHSGIIGAKRFDPGTNVTPGISVYELITISSVYVKVSVSENEINLIKKGQLAQVEIPALNLKKVSGLVNKVGVQSNLLSRTYEVKIKVDNANLRIKPGMVCDVKINLEQDQSVNTIPYKAIIKDKENAT